MPDFFQYYVNIFTFKLRNSIFNITRAIKNELMPDFTFNPLSHNFFRTYAFHNCFIINTLLNKKQNLKLILYLRSLQSLIINNRKEIYNSHSKSRKTFRFLEFILTSILRSILVKYMLQEETVTKYKHYRRGSFSRRLLTRTPKERSIFPVNSTEKMCVRA